MHLFLPQAVKTVISVLENAGYEAFCVGGAVRDMLMGRTSPSDFDVTTNCLPEDIARLFPHNIPTGIKHGTVTVICDGMAIEVTTYRTEGGYSDARHPDKVEFVSNIRDDLSRRDFTVNAIAYNEKSGIFDPFSGLKDIESKTLRAVGEPEKRFEEDALRIMRLYRFASQLGFLPDSATENGAKEKLHLLPKISAERIFSELSRLLCGEHIALAAPLFLSGGLEFLGIKKYDTALFCALPNELDIRFSAYALMSGSDAEAVLSALKADNKLKNSVKTIISLHSAQIPKTRREVKEMLYFAEKDCFFKYLCVLSLTDSEAAQKIKCEAEDILKKSEPYKISELAVCGDDLKALGLCGSEIGKVLKGLLRLVWENPSLNKKETLLSLITK